MTLEQQIEKCRTDLATYQKAFTNLNKEFVQMKAQRDFLQDIVESNQKAFDRLQDNLNRLMDQTRSAMEGVLKAAGLPDEVIASALSVFPPKVS